jgi:hypothetical protein
MPQKKPDISLNRYPAGGIGLDINYIHKGDCNPYVDIRLPGIEQPDKSARLSLFQNARF